MKRKTVIVLLVLMALLLCACGSKETPEEDFAFEMVDGEIIITGYLGTERAIVIPEEINDRPVTVIGEEAFCQYDMLTIELPSKLRVIETNAFSACDCLTSVRFPASLKRIEDGAFWNCKKLVDIKLPEGLEYLGDGAFGACDSLLTLELPEKLEGFCINQYYSYFGNPVSDHTMLLIKEGSIAQKLIEMYGNGRVNYMIVDEEKDNQKETVVYLVKEKCIYNSENVIIKRIQYNYDEKGNVLTEEIDIGEPAEIWNEELMVYEYIEGKVDGTIDQINTWTYDMFRNVLTYVGEGYSNFSEEYQYTYEGGMLVRCTTSDNKYAHDYKCEYDTKSRLVSITMNKDYLDKAIEFSFEYNNDGSLARVVWESENSADIFVYDKDGRVVEVKSEEGEARWVYKYNSQGLMTSKKWYNSENEITKCYEYSYNRKNQLEEECITIIEDGQAKVEKVRYSYIEVKMSGVDAEAYNQRTHWQWCMEQTGIRYLINKF